MAILITLHKLKWDLIPGFNPRAIAVNPNTNKIYLGSGGSNIVSVIDARTKNVTQVKVGLVTNRYGKYSTHIY